MVFIFAWLAALFTTATPLILKVAGGNSIKSPWLLNIFWVGFAAIFGGAVGLVRGGGLPQDWIVLVLNSAASALFYIFYMTALYKINVSVMAPLFSFRVVFAVILGAVFLDEQLTAPMLALVGLVILMSPFASYDESLRYKAFFQPGVLLALAAMLALALVGFLNNRSVEVNGAATTLLWQDALTVSMLAPFLKVVDFKKENISRKTVSVFAVVGLLSAGYAVTSIEAFSRNLAISSVIISIPLSMIAAVLFAKKFPELRESHSRRVYTIRFSAAAVMIGCAVVLSLM